MIEAVIFDFGNVIYSFDRKKFLAYLLPYTDMTPEKVFTRIYSSDIQEKYETGLISSKEFYREVCLLLNIDIGEDEFAMAFNSMFAPVEGMFDLIRDLKRNVRLGLLSNTNDLHFRYTISRVEAFKLFDTVTLSYEVGEMKPGAGIYRDALSKLNVPPERCVYVDDVKEYAEAASSMGINGIQFKDRAVLIESLKKLGVPVSL